MKRFVAAALIMATLSAPAAARSNDILTGVVIGVIASEVFKPKERYPNLYPYVTLPPAHNILNDPRRPGYVRGLDREGRGQVCQIIPQGRSYGYTVNLHVNCYGEVIAVDRIPNF
jgi:hypothetical protein